MVLIIKSNHHYLSFTIAFHHAARSIAFAAKENPVSARAEQKAFVLARKSVPEDWIIGNNPCEDVLNVVAHMVGVRSPTGKGRSKPMKQSCLPIGMRKSGSSQISRFNRPASVNPVYREPKKPFASRGGAFAEAPPFML